MRAILAFALCVVAAAADAECLTRTSAGWKNGCNFSVGVRWRDHGRCASCSCTAVVGGNDTMNVEFVGRVTHS